MQFDESRAVDRLLRFLSVEGTTGQEKNIAQEVIESLLAAGVARKWIHFDEANRSIPLPTQTGNLIVTLPGNTAGRRTLFMAHMDTVPLCAGAVPKRQGKRRRGAHIARLWPTSRRLFATQIT